jgi:hypothetical protein
MERETLETAAQLARDVYKDLAHPTAQRVGQALETISKVALSPVSLLDWSFEQVKDWLKQKVTSRLQSIPPEFIAAPSLTIAVPAITHVAMAHDSPGLRELYAELLMKAMDTRTKESVHPSYVYVVEQLTSEEALVLASLHALKKDDLFMEVMSYPYYGQKTPTIEYQFLEHCKSIGVREADRSSLWLDNLLRLRLLSISSYSEQEYVPEEYSRDGILSPSVKTTETRSLSFTTFGKEFIQACTPP